MSNVVKNDQKTIRDAREAKAIERDMVIETKVDALDALNALVGFTVGAALPCVRGQDTSCLRQHEARGLNYSIDVPLPAKVLQSLCNACLTHWYVCVARNALIAVMRQG